MSYYYRQGSLGRTEFHKFWKVNFHWPLATKWLFLLPIYGK